MFCEACGKPLLDGQAFCSNCGARQIAEQPAAQPIAQPVVQPAPVSYVQQAPVTEPAPVKQKNSAAVAGLVFAIISMFLGLIPVIGWIICIVALVCSIIGVVNIKKMNSGAGQAIAGLIISITYTVISVIFTILLAVSVLAVGTSTYLERTQAAAEEIRAHNAEVEDIDFEDYLT